MGTWSACLILQYALLQTADSQWMCPKFYVLATDYKCDLKIDGFHFDMMCQGQVNMTSDHGDDYDCSLYVYHLSYDVSDDDDGSHAPNNASGHSLFHLPDDVGSYHTSSNFLTCHRPTRGYLTKDLLSTSYCIKYPDCMSLAKRVISEKFVTSLSINNRNTFQQFKSSFKFFRNLTELSITGCSLETMGDGDFSELQSLQKLSLRKDGVVYLPTGFLNDLRELRELDLSHNSIREFPMEVLAPAPSLVSLNLGFNNIRNIDEDAFSLAPGLTDITLVYNELHALPPNFFRKTSQVLNVDIGNNVIRQLSDGLFQNLSNLTLVNVSGCSLKCLTKDIFKNSYNITVFNASRNEISFLPEDIFERLPDLLYVDMSHNKLSWIGERTLRKNYKLCSIDLKYNLLVRLPPKMFLRNRVLRILNLRGNKLNLLSEKLLEKFEDLYTIDASQNNISYIGFFNEIRVQKMNFSRNRIEKLEIRWEKLVFLENADFDFNDLKSLVLPSCINNMKQLTAFSFRSCNLSNIQLPYVIKLDGDLTRYINCFFNGQPKNSILLGGNPFNCDAKLYEFYRYFKKQMPNVKLFHDFPDHGEWKCSMPPLLHNRQVETLGRNEFLTDLKEGCPETCSCGLRARDGLVVVNCTAKRLTRIPETSPQNVSILYMQSNRLSRLNTLNLKTWENLSELYLEDNVLNEIETKNLPKSLKILFFSGNRLKDISSPLKKFVSQREDIKIRMSNNRFNCSCSLKPLRTWLSNNAQKIDDIANVTCYEKAEKRALTLHKIPIQILCPENKVLNIKLIVGVTCSSILVIFALCAALVYSRNKETVRAFLYGTSVFRYFFCNKDEDDNKIFDAFVAYSSKDQPIVMQLVNELENTPPFFRLCVHERDWIPGNFISENIVYSVQNSKRIVVVLSDNFVKSIWFGVEVRAALFQMIQEKTNRLLVIVVGKFPSADEMEKDIRQVLLRRTYLVWGERWFWQKLRYALPHKSTKDHAESHKALAQKFEFVNLVESEISAAFGPGTTLLENQTDDELENFEDTNVTICDPYT